MLPAESQHCKLSDKKIEVGWRPGARHPLPKPTPLDSSCTDR